MDPDLPPDSPLPTRKNLFQPVPTRLTAAQIREEVYANARKSPRQRISQKALAKRLEVPLWRVYAVTHAMKKKSREGKHRDKKDLLSATTTEEDAMLSQILDGTIPDIDERRKIAARLIVTAKDEVKLKAIDALATLEKGSDDHVGPPPPTDPEQQQARLRRIIAAAGKAEAIQAFEAEFGGSVEWENYVASRDRSMSVSSDASRSSGTTQPVMETSMAVLQISPASVPLSITPSDT